MRSKPSVCRDCAERRIGCHSACEKYANECSENRKRNEALAAEHSAFYVSSIELVKNRANYLAQKHNKRRREQG